jgi:hypothetical protein
MKRFVIIIENLYHAHYTACQLEDEIRLIRKQDYPYRKKYDDLKNLALGVGETAPAAEEE